MLILPVVFTGLLSAAPLTFNFEDRNGPRQITFESRAPAEYIEGTAEGLVGVVTMDPAKPGLALHATLSVPVARMQTGVQARDEHLRSVEWLNETRYPAIRFDLSAVDPKRISKKGPDHWFVKAEGQFSLKGISRTIQAPVTLRREGDKLTITGRFNVKLSDHNVMGPAGLRMIGAKVADTVAVNLNLVGVQDAGWGHVKKSSKPAMKGPAPKPILFKKKKSGK